MSNFTSNPCTVRFVPAHKISRLWLIYLLSHPKFLHWSYQIKISLQEDVMRGIKIRKKLMVCIPSRMQFNALVASAQAATCTHQATVDDFFGKIYTPPHSLPLIFSTNTKSSMGFKILRLIHWSESSESAKKTIYHRSSITVLL